jgi:CrcB protein
MKSELDKFYAAIESLDTAMMIERGLWSVAIGYALVSVIGSVIALFGGLFLVRAVA